VGNLPLPLSHGATSHIVKRIIVKKALMDHWKHSGHDEKCPRGVTETLLLVLGGTATVGGCREIYIVGGETAGPRSLQLTYLD
jgi:hypothetical protein